MRKRRRNREKPISESEKKQNSKDTRSHIAKLWPLFCAGAGGIWGILQTVFGGNPNFLYAIPVIVFYLTHLYVTSLKSQVSPSVIETASKDKPAQKVAFSIEDQIFTVLLGTHQINMKQSDLIKGEFPILEIEEKPVLSAKMEDGHFVLDGNWKVVADENFSLKSNVISDVSQSFDLNHSPDWRQVEIVSKDSRLPVFQLSYESDTCIRINGIFLGKSEIVVADDSQFRKIFPDLRHPERNIPYKIFLKRKFKYPAAQFPGILNDGKNEAVPPRGLVKVITSIGAEKEADLLGNWIFSLAGWDGVPSQRSYTREEAPEILTITAESTEENEQNILHIMQGIIRSPFVQKINTPFRRIYEKPKTGATIEIVVPKMTEKPNTKAKN